MSRSDILAKVRRIVVKIGTRVLTDDNGGLDTGRIEHLAEQICDMKRQGRAVAVVTSGAIGAGLAALGVETRPESTAKLQAAAAIGQSRLMGIYSKCFEAHGYHAAQILLTREDFSAFDRYTSARRTFAELNKLGAIPVVNENDTTSVEEVTFGDNDLLSALVTSLFEGDLLILLSTISGLYDSRDESRTVIEEVDSVTAQVQNLSSGEVSQGGVGGMDSKLQAIKMATEFGEPVVLANGKTDSVLDRIMAGEKLGTYFHAAARRVASRKRWLMFGARPKGRISVDAGAVAALLHKGTSLLPSGMVWVAGRFDRGELVDIVSPDGDVVGRGIAGYGADEARKLCGVQTEDIAEIAGEKPCDEMVHRDDMVIFHGGRPL